MSLRITWRELLEYRAEVYERDASKRILPDEGLPLSLVGDDAEDKPPRALIDVKLKHTDAEYQPDERDPAPAQQLIDISNLELDTETLDFRSISNSADALRDQAVLDFIYKQTIHRANFEKEIDRLGIITTKLSARSSTVAKTTKKLDY